MTIERSDIEKLAELARIRITDENVAATIRGINEVLALVDQLQAVDTAGIEPMAHPLDASQRLRADAVTEANQRDAFLAIAPASTEGFYLVPQVLD
ncbi:MAG: Asp-tRNA(Asn)/Glu-tRNA(Gln) amidotransferase subunit GatC [Porticoccaceae bacterium]